MKKKIGHNFLAQLGKKRLRPGGIEATEWLLKQGGFSADKKVLEVACNMGTTLVEVAQRFDCKIIGVDLDAEALVKAQTNIQKAGLEEQAAVQQGNAFKLPFADNSFDIVINEAMLTMLDDPAKVKALTEYYRVLKPGGKLLTHDIATKDEQQLEALSQAIHMRVAPLTVADWRQKYTLVGYRKVAQQTGAMSLMSPRGLLRDEGLTGTVKIVRNGLKKDNRQQFLEMFHYFRQQQGMLSYIVNCAEK